MSNRREKLKIVSGQVFIFKLDSLASYRHVGVVFIQPILELKALASFRPVNLSLSMSKHYILR
jgi:hypothetical protein